MLNNFVGKTILVLKPFSNVIITKKSLLDQEKLLSKYKIYCKMYINLKNTYTVVMQLLL